MIKDFMLGTNRNEPFGLSSTKYVNKTEEK